MCVTVTGSQGSQAPREGAGREGGHPQHLPQGHVPCPDSEGGCGTSSSFQRTKTWGEKHCSGSQLGA